MNHLPDIYAELSVRDQRKKELEEQTEETHALLEDTINRKAMENTKQKKDSVVKEPMLINTWGGNPLAEASSYLKA